MVGGNPERSSGIKRLGKSILVHDRLDADVPQERVVKGGTRSQSNRIEGAHSVRFIRSPDDPITRFAPLPPGLHPSPSQFGVGLIQTLCGTAGVLGKAGFWLAGGGASLVAQSRFPQLRQPELSAIHALKPLRSSSSCEFPGHEHSSGLLWSNFFASWPKDNASARIVLGVRISTW